MSEEQTPEGAMVMVPREDERVRSSSDEQLIDQARVLFEKFRNVSSLGVDEAWIIRQGGSDWSVIATRQTTHPDATPYEVVKATTRDPYVAAMLTFMSTGLPRLCDLADQALAATQQSPISTKGEARSEPKASQHPIRGEGELLPCPFCGSAKLVPLDFKVWCESCHAYGPPAMEQGDGLFTAWNRRAHPPTSYDPGTSK